MPPKKEKGPQFHPKDMVLAKMSGFPAWPSFVMPPETIPEAILKAKKKTTNTCVIFIPDGDFYWMNEKSLEALSAEKLQAKIDKLPKDKLKSKPKTKPTRTTNVIDAFLAANGLDFDHFMGELDSAKRALEEGEDGESETNEDEEDVEGGEESGSGAVDGEDEQLLSNSKLKDDADGKGSVAGGKLDSVKSKKSKDEDSKASVAPKRRPGRPSKKHIADLKSANDAIDALKEKDATSSHSEDDSKDTETVDSKHDSDEKESKGTPAPGRKRTRGNVDASASPDSTKTNGNNTDSIAHEELPAKRQARGVSLTSPKASGDKDKQHQLWLCRIKLQRSLIQRNQPVTPKDPKNYPPPTVDELSMARIILQKLADFPVSVDLLRDTKIHKVLKCIIKDEDLEYPESFRLHEKCTELLEKWQELIDKLKSGRPVSRVGSYAPEDSEVSGIELKPTLEKDDAEKVDS